MSAIYTLVNDLIGLVPNIPPQSIISRAIHSDGALKAIVFGFDADQSLSEHTSSHAAIIHILRGEASVSLGEDHHELSAGAWVYMPPRLNHSIHAKTPLWMLLLILEVI